MLFNSFQFLLIFLPIALAGYYLLSPLGPRAAGAWLVLASAVFYSYWNVKFLLLLLGSIAFNFTVARLIFAVPNRKGLQSNLLVFAIAVNIGVLIYYKYLFALLGFLRLHGVIDIPFAAVVLPLGISFFTFTQIGYLVDVKQGLAKDRDILDYLIFVTFFPHLIAGPILHNREMMPQFASKETYRFSSTNLAIGLTIFAIGLAKKVVIADHISPIVEEGFSSSATITTLAAWHSAIYYSFQLYFDFSGYSDMAIGLARMFNIKFPVNFNSPFKATSVVDYWQRFHMTLTRFVTMYVFSPIALWATRRQMARASGASRNLNATPSGFTFLVLMPTLITMALLGIWHGAGLQYLIFGLLHGIYITANHAARIFMPDSNKKDRSPGAALILHAAKVLSTCLAVLVAMVFFRSSSIRAALDMLAGMTGLHGSQNQGSDSTAMTVLKVGFYYGFVWMTPNTQQIMSRVEPALGKPVVNYLPWLCWKLDVKWMLAAAGLLGLSLANMGSHSEFLYFQF